MFSKPQDRSDLNDNVNYRIGGNVRNVGIDIKCHTFSKPQPLVDLNDDGNFRNGGNARNFENFKIDRQTSNLI